MAAPLLDDPNFARTVILLLDHDDEGSLGLVLNRPSHVPVGAVLPTWDGRTTGTDVLFTGRPGADDSALALGSCPDRTTGPSRTASAASPAPSASSTSTSTPPSPSAELSRRPDLRGIRRVGPGQLDDEVAEGAWYVVDGGPGDVFDRARRSCGARCCAASAATSRSCRLPSTDPSLN